MELPYRQILYSLSEKKMLTIRGDEITEKGLNLLIILIRYLPRHDYSVDAEEEDDDKDTLLPVLPRRTTVLLSYESLAKKIAKEKNLPYVIFQDPPWRNGYYLPYYTRRAGTDQRSGHGK
jgi:hypothetical protein